MRESAVERRLGEKVKALGGMSIKLAPTVAGVPDRLVLLPGGKAIFVEVKADDGRLSRVQSEWHWKAETLGHTVVTLYGSRQVDEWISRQSDTRTL